MESAVSPKRKCPLDKRERFVKLYDLIVDIFRTYTANFVWTAGLFSVANGWFLSSTSSRDFIRDSLPAFRGAILVVCVVGLLHTGSCWMYYRRSQERIAQLAAEYEDLHPLPFRDYEIRTSIFIVNLLVSWALVAGLLAFLVAAHSSPASL
jgi:hypothetical protein